MLTEKFWLFNHHITLSVPDEASSEVLRDFIAQALYEAIQIRVRTQMRFAGIEHFDTPVYIVTWEDVLTVIVDTVAELEIDSAHLNLDTMEHVMQEVKDWLDASSVMREVIEHAVYSILQEVRDESNR